MPEAPVATPPGRDASPRHPSRGSRVDAPEQGGRSQTDAAGQGRLADASERHPYLAKAKTARARQALPVGEDRRAHILAAAQRVFESKGLEGANMRAIAREAHYTVGALYFYYKSREEIYADLLTTSLWRLKDFTQAAAKDAQTPAEQMQTRAMAFYDYYATRPDEMSLGFYLHRGLGPHGLTHTLDERLNAQFWMTLIGVLDPLLALGRTQAEAVRELTAIVAHGVGLLLLLHTGRIRLFHQDGREVFRAFVEASLGREGRSQNAECRSQKF